MDEVEDVVSTAELAAEWTQRAARGERGCAKWAVVAVHSMLQGAMVVVLSGSDGTGALDERSRVKILEWFSRGRGSGPAPGWATAPFPKERLADFKELLRRVTRSKDAGGFGPREPLRLNGDQVADLHRLHWARNQYAHFTPKTWTVEGVYLALSSSWPALSHEPSWMNRMCASDWRTRIVSA